MSATERTTTQSADTEPQVHPEQQVHPEPQVHTEQLVFTTEFTQSGSDLWAYYHIGGQEVFSPTELDRLNSQETYLIIPGATISEVKVIQSVGRALCLSLGLTDYSPLTERLADTCHCGTYQSDGETFLVVIQKQLLAHMINISYGAYQKIYHRPPTSFSIRVSSRGAQPGHSISNQRPTDTTCYLKVENFRDYLGDTHIGDESFQVGVYVGNKSSQRLAQVSSYSSIGH